MTINITNAGGAPVALFAQTIKERMEQKGMTSIALSDRVGCSYMYVRRLITGKSLPSRVMLRAIADALQLDARELEKLVVKDKFRSKHGELALEAQGIRPDMEHIMSDWADLTPEQRAFYTAQIAMQAKIARQNRSYDGVLEP